MTEKIHCFCCDEPRTFYACGDAGCLHCIECDDIVQEEGEHSERIVSEGPTLRDTHRVTVLDDGDNTTWAGDAFIIELTHDEYGEVRGGNDKIMRNLAAEGRATYSANRMLDCIRRISRTLKAKNGSMDMLRADLRSCGFLDE